MVKGGKKGKRNGNTRKGPKPKPKPQRSIDGAAADHAKLLLDPCGAPLAHPVYSGGEGGYLVRTESINQIFFGAGVTGGVFHWTPGAINSANTEQLWNNSVGGAATVISTQNGAPGKAFLQNSSLARCVAACIRISYAGAESARAGRIYYGRTSGSLVNNGDVIAPEVLAGSLQHFTRTPVGDVEVLWMPNDSDQQLVDPNEALSAEARARRAAITIVANGLPADVGLIIRQTAIYEWQPIQNAGVAVPNNSRARSSSTLDQVLNVVQGALKGGAALADAAFGGPGGAVRGVASFLSTMYGNMPSVGGRKGPAMIGYY